MSSRLWKTQATSFGSGCEEKIQASRKGQSRRRWMSRSISLLAQTTQSSLKLQSPRSTGSSNEYTWNINRPTLEEAVVREVGDSIHLDHRWASCLRRT